LKKVLVAELQIGEMKLSVKKVKLNGRLRDFFKNLVKKPKNVKINVVSVEGSFSEKLSCEAFLQSFPDELKDRQFTSFEYKVSLNWVKTFFSSIQNKAYEHPEGVAVSFSFLSCFRDSELALIHELGVSLSQVLHVKQGFQYFSKFYIDDSIQSSSKILKIKRLKKDGAMVMILIENEYRKNSELCAVGKGTIFIRNL